MIKRILKIAGLKLNLGVYKTWLILDRSKISGYKPVKRLSFNLFRALKSLSRQRKVA